MLNKCSREIQEYTTLITQNLACSHDASEYLFKFLIKDLFNLQAKESTSYRTKTNIISTRTIIDVFLGTICNFGIMCDWHMIDYLIKLGLEKVILVALRDYSDPCKIQLIYSIVMSIRALQCLSIFLSYQQDR